jgi:hypothetical protein
MIHLCSSNIMVGIFVFCFGFVGSLVVGVGCFGYYLWGMVFCSIWDVYGL